MRTRHGCSAIATMDVAGDKRVEALSEPAVHRSEKVAGLLPLALIAPEPRHTHRGAKFPGLCLLLPQRLRALAQNMP